MENIVQLFNNAIGWSIIHSLWQGASLYIILYGLFLIFYKLSSDIKYKIAYIFQFLLFASFIFTCINYLQIASNLSHASMNHTEHDLEHYLLYLQNESWAITKIFPYIVALYAIGLMVQTFLCLKSFAWIKKIKRKSSELIPEDWKKLLERIAEQHKTPRSLPLLVSAHIDGPITVGFLKPVILFPTAYVNKISLEEAEAILLHEIAHIKRYDYLFNIALITIETILFFNPFVWLISRHIKIEREQSCDDYVTRSIQNPVVYARTLLHVELLRNEYKTAQALALSGHNKFDLLNRIKRLNQQIMETKYTSYKQQLSVILSASLTFIFIAWMNPKSEATPSEKRTLIHTIVDESTTVNETFDTLKPQKPVVAVVKKNVLTPKNDTSKAVTPHYEEDKAIEELVKNIEIDSKSLEKAFDSEQWKIILSKIEASTKDLEKHFNSPEFKNKIARIELNNKDLEAYFESTAWKDKIQKLELSTKNIEEYFDSPEWKDKVAKIEINSKKIEEKFNSPEWQKKMKDMQELYNSIEYIELQEKFNNEVQNLKTQKGIN